MTCSFCENSYQGFGGIAVDCAFGSFCMCDTCVGKYSATVPPELVAGLSGDVLGKTKKDWASSLLVTNVVRRGVELQSGEALTPFSGNLGPSPDKQKELIQ